MAEPYTLPDLSYDYGALEPHISGEIMQLHHSKHHAKYVSGANTALEQAAEARDSGQLASVNLLGAQPRLQPFRACQPLCVLAEHVAGRG